MSKRKLRRGYVPRNASLTAYAEFVRSEHPLGYRVWRARSEAAFCKAVDEVLEWCIRELESIARHQQDSTEEGLSAQIWKMLLAGGVRCSAEEYQNGHVDITIRGSKRRAFKIIGECKIWRGPAWHVSGCSQLLERYATGRERQMFCLAFFKVPDMYGKLSALRLHFDTEKPLGQCEAAIVHKNIEGGFLTLHAHSAGRELWILHLGCNLFHPAAFSSKK